jgi:hypothetical protein
VVQAGALVSFGLGRIHPCEKWVIFGKQIERTARRFSPQIGQIGGRLRCGGSGGIVAQISFMRFDLSSTTSLNARVHPTASFSRRSSSNSFASGYVDAAITGTLSAATDAPPARMARRDVVLVIGVALQWFVNAGRADSDSERNLICNAWDRMAIAGCSVQVAAGCSNIRPLRLRLRLFGILRNSAWGVLPQGFWRLTPGAALA